MIWSNPGKFLTGRTTTQTSKKSTTNIIVACYYKEMVFVILRIREVIYEL